jgi:hypothetical protein
MQAHITAATKSLGKNKESVKELTTLAKAQSGIARKELDKVISKK